MNDNPNSRKPEYPVENLERLIIFALQNAGKGLTWAELISTPNLKNKPVVDIGSALRNLVDDGKLSSTHPKDFNEEPVISLASPTNPPVSETRLILDEVTGQPPEITALKKVFPQMRIDTKYAVSPVKNLTPSRYKIKGMPKDAAVNTLKEAGWKIEGETEHRNGSTTGMTNGEMHITLYDSGKYPYYFGDTAIEITPTRGNRPYNGPSVVEPAAPTPKRPKGYQ